MKLFTWLIVVATTTIKSMKLQPSVSGSGVKSYPGLENLPRSLWHELSSPFTEIYEEGIFATDIGSTPEPRPCFEDPDNNITTHLGSDIHMHCRVRDLFKEAKVSWFRRRGEELHLLTVDVNTYSNDARFSLDYQQPNDWQLHIRSISERDAGLYECQISVHPPLIRTVHVFVSVPKVEIVDEHGATAGDKFYKAGSTIELKCVVSQVPQPTGYVVWKHGSRMLNYDTTRGGISVKTEMGFAGATSKLYIANANKHDSGNYSCALVDIAATTVSVHVLNGENPAAMQHGGCVNSRAHFILIVLLKLALILR